MKRTVVAATLILLASGGNSMAQEKVTPALPTIESGAFGPSFESFDGYQCPAWFRDAKFGIWSHWGPQSVPMMGDWYAKRMYQEGGDAYNEHLKLYGHPSKSGYKDIIPLWHAEKWNPDALMDLYVKAGAKYFVSMAVHHDNFDLWHSKYQPRWNATATGPKRDVVAEWQRAAKKHGLPFGVSEHLGASYNWFQESHKSDKKGDMTGVAYDGADPQWQDLYHPPSLPGDTDWLTNNPVNQRDWFNRIKDLIDTYHPELLYSDSGFPFGDTVGKSLIAHFYNANMKANGGRLTAVYNCKQGSDGRWVQDVERGVLKGINPQPWQTDTSIGDWFYRTNDHYKTPTQVIHMLCDIVSKNGNLLLNVVQRPDGSLEAQPQAILQALSQWMPVNGEAIYGTRPWLVFGEGTPNVKEGNFNENSMQFGAGDIRYTRKGDTLYAIVLGWPDKNVTLRALADGAVGVLQGPKTVSLLGDKSRLKWTQSKAGLEIQLPNIAPNQYAVVFKIEGAKWNDELSADAKDEWQKQLMPTPVKIVRAAPDGTVNLTATLARLHGSALNLEGADNARNIGFWDNAKDWVSWDKIEGVKANRYRVEAEIAAPNDGAVFTLKIAGQTLRFKTPKTGAGWTDYQTVNVGEVALPNGEIEAEIRPDATAWTAINLRAIRLIPLP